MTLDQEIEIAMTDYEQARDALSAARERATVTHNILWQLVQERTKIASADPTPGDLFATECGAWLLVERRDDTGLVVRLLADPDRIPEAAPTLFMTLAQFRERYPRARLERHGAFAAEEARSPVAHRELKERGRLVPMP